MKNIFVSFVAFLLLFLNIDLAQSQILSHDLTHYEQNIIEQYLSKMALPMMLYGPKEYKRSTGKVTVERDTFSLRSNSIAPYTMLIINGDSARGGIVSGKIFLNGIQIFSASDFKKNTPILTKTVTLQAHNTLEITVAGAPGSKLLLCILGELSDTSAPALAVASPDDGVVTKNNRVTVSGTVTDQSVVSITINGVNAALDTVGTFSGTVELSDGMNTLTIIATDIAGNATTVRRYIRKDTAAPVISLLLPSNETLTQRMFIVIDGIISDSSSFVVTVNGRAILVGSNGAIHDSVALVEGQNTITLMATDAAGNISTETRSIFCDATSPVLVVLTPLDETVTQDAVVMVSGTVDDATSVSVKVNGVAAPVVDGRFNVPYTLVEGSNTLVIVATDTVGNTVSIARTVTLQTSSVRIPPDPSSVATPIDRTVSTTLAAATRFLYTGAHSIQTGVDTTAMNPMRLGIIRGKVLSGTIQALKGVKVSVLDHPEYGYTISRADGMYDIAVNGGGALVLTFNKDGYLPVQRQVDVPWQTYVFADSVIMIPMDDRVTTVTFSDTLEVARGSVVSDANGSRQATLMFKQGTLASMTLANGEEIPLSTPSVRATEYTVGKHGPARMPAQLPPASAYTYCVELSVDEAIAAGATDVKFTQPVALYVENFIGFPTGTPVPAGYYDRKRSVWVPSDNGVVVKIVGVDGGKALIAAHVSETAEDDTTLSALGISDAERARLASQYTIGQSLWRVAVDHFTPWDCNWPYIPPVDAVEPEAKAETPKTDNPSTECGSIIGVQNQTLGEVVPLTGTPYSLYYSSEKTEGYKQFIDIPVTGQSIPQSLQSIVVEIEVAGTKTEKIFEPAPNLSWKFYWNQRDGYGRIIQGKQTANIKIGYVYPAQYATPQQFERAFGAATSSPRQPLITASRDGMSLTYWRTWDEEIGTWISPKSNLGGWTIGDHHSYDANSATIFYGTTEKRSAQAMARIIQTIAGNGTQESTGDGGAATHAEVNGTRMCVAPDGSIYFLDEWNMTVRKIDSHGIITTVVGNNIYSSRDAGDGGPATAAKLSYSMDIAVGPDGSLYIAASRGNRVRRVSPDGIITTFAGTGIAGFSGDGGKATDAKLNWPQAVEVGPDGSVYIGDAGNNRVRKVSPDGIITTVAGNGNAWELDADGILATESSFTGIMSLAVAQDGTLYIADIDQNRIRKVDINGIISTVAGSGKTDWDSGYEYPTQRGDGGLATQAQLIEPEDIALDSDGSLYIVDSDAHEVRKVHPNGIITRYAGKYGTRPGSWYGKFSGDGGPASQADLKSPTGIALGKDGTVYIVDQDNYRIRQVADALSKYTAADFVVPSEDGAVLYHFDDNGKHLKTTNALTGATHLTLSYTSNGSLESLTDESKQTTMIERDTLGNPIAIISPYGQRTRLTLDASGHLASLTNPAGETTSFVYTPTGLLLTMKDARQAEKHYEYTSDGRLRKATDAAGGGRTLRRTELVNGYEVLSVTAEKEKTCYRVESIPSSGVRSTRIDPDGLATVSTDSLSGTITTINPDGTTQKVISRPDPRFGMLASVASVVTSTPGGLTSVMSHTRTITQMAGLTVMGVTDSVNVNGKAFKTSYDGLRQLFTSTSPQGRKSFTVIDSVGRTLTDSLPGIEPVHYFYDAKGRTSSVTQGRRQSTFAYDAMGRVSSATDPLMRIAGFAYDSVGRTLLQTLPDHKTIAYRYDENGNLLGLIPPEKGEHTFTYTATDLTSQYLPPALGADTTATLYRYDLDKRITSTVLPNGDSIVVKYDTAGCGCGASASRIKSISYDRGMQTFAYDPLTGALANTVTPSADTMFYTYDGQLPKSVEWKGQVNGSVGVTYDSSFRVKTQSVNGGNTLSFSYSDDGLITSFGAMSLTYNPQNRLPVGSALGNISTSQGYSQYGELANFSATYSGTPLFATSYSRDSLGRIVKLSESIQGVAKTMQYGYDTAGHLETVWRNDTLVSRYSYDANGNRLSRWTPSGTDTGAYDAQDRMLAYANATYSYSRNGDLRSKVIGTDTTRYSYDNLGNLREVTMPNGERIEYLIDGQNRRIAKIINGTVVKRWLYAGELSPVAELDSAGNVDSRFVGGYFTKGGATYRLITDHLGSVRMVVNVATGAVAQKIDYDEFGNVTSDSNPDFQPFGYAGGLYDAQTGLVRFGARDYDASAGRWTVKDPIGFGSRAANVYSYLDSDPINAIDPSGRAKIILAGRSIGGKGGKLSPEGHAALIVNLGTENAPDHYIVQGGPGGPDNSKLQGRLVQTGPQGWYESFANAEGANWDTNESMRVPVNILAEMKIPDDPCMTREKLQNMVNDLNNKFGNSNYNYNNGPNSNTYVKEFLRMMGISMPIPPAGMILKGW